MLTVPEAAKRAGRSPETVRRWIRSGRLRARKVGTQHVVEEADLLPFIDEPWPVDIPPAWLTDDDGRPQPDWERIVRETRDSR